MRSLIVRGIAAVLFWAVTPFLYAQSTTQEIQGFVTDTSGTVAAGVKVIITNIGTGVSRTVETNAPGNYSFPLAPVGDYEVKVEMPGFKTETAKGVR